MHMCATVAIVNRYYARAFSVWYFRSFMNNKILCLLACYCWRRRAN